MAFSPGSLKPVPKKHETSPIQFKFYEKDQLSEECLQLKRQLGELEDKNSTLKNRIVFLEQEIQKRDKIVDSLHS